VRHLIGNGSLCNFIAQHFIGRAVDHASSTIINLIPGQLAVRPRLIIIEALYKVSSSKTEPRQFSTLRDPTASLTAPTASRDGTTGYRQCSVSPLTVWTFMSGNQCDIQCQKGLFLQHTAGASHPSEKRYQALNDHVTRALTAYGRAEVLVYLHSIVYFVK